MKDWLKKVLPVFLFNSSQDNKSNNKFEDLTPLDNLPKDQYMEALEWALSNDRIKNIALTGTYGSGKSSILRSFENKDIRRQYLNISLASFSIEDDEADPDDDELNRLLERSILQQIFYKADPADIPESRFKRIFSVKKRTLIISSFLTLIWLFSAFELFQPSSLDFIDLWQNFAFRDNILLDYLFLLIFLTGAIGITFQTFRLFNNLKFSKLNFTKGEIELADDIDASILNEHLDEILYYFEVQKYNVVIIEDIDRFNSVDIFTKLRELNTLLNQSKQVNRKIVFIYAIRDELFQDIHDHLNSRTKFFDFIIPVIPVINSNNSFELLSKRLDSGTEKGELSKLFLTEISIFIDDMRVLKNICNEYFIYKEKLQGVGLDQEILFSIIVYKNLFPKDFSMLNHKKGMVYKVFENKEAIIQQRKETINQNIKAHEEKIELIQKENLNTVKELRNQYIGEFLKYISHNQNDGVKSFDINSQQYDLYQIIDDANFKLLKKQGKISYRSTNGNRRYNSNITFNDLEKSIDEELSYDDRETIINNKTDNSIEEIKYKIEALKKEKSTLSSRKIEELLDEASLSQLLGEEVIKHDLLVYLFRNGYLDDQVYENYITYFYEGALKRNDMRFVQRVKNRSALSFDFELSNIDEIVKKLRLREFSYVEILNIDLLNFLFDHESKYSKELSSVASLLSNNSKKSAEFIDSFIEKSKKNIPAFINKVSKTWNKIWWFIDNDLNYPENKINDYLNLIIRYADIEDIIDINDSSNDSLKKYISSKKNFVENYDGDDDIERVKEVLFELQVKFNSLEATQKNSDLWQCIYNENLYEINSYMVKLILELECNSSEDFLNQFNKAPYSTIKASESEVLKSYINNNIEVFVKNILLTVEPELEEEEENFIELLNNQNISLEEKEELIEKQNGLVTNLSEVKRRATYLKLFQSMKVSPSWPNIIIYYEKIEKLNSTLCKYLNDKNNYKPLSKHRLDEFDFHDSVIETLSEEITLNKEITDDSFKYLVKSIPFQYSELDFTSLNRLKVKALIENKVLSVSPQNYKLLKSNKFSPLHLELIETDTDSFINNFNDFVDLDDFQVDEELADLVLEVFLKSKPEKVSVDLSEKIIRKGKVTASKIKFLNSQIDFLDRQSVAALINALPYRYQKMNKSRNRTKIKNTDYNLELCDKLLNIDFISSYKEIDNETIQVNAKV